MILMHTCIFLNAENSHTISLILYFEYDGKIHVNMNMIVPIFYLNSYEWSLSVVFCRIVGKTWSVLFLE